MLLFSVGMSLRLFLIVACVVYAGAVNPRYTCSVMHEIDYTNVYEAASVPGSPYYGMNYGDLITIGSASLGCNALFGWETLRSVACGSSNNRCAGYIQYEGCGSIVPFDDLTTSCNSAISAWRYNLTVCFKTSIAAEQQYVLSNATSYLSTISTSVGRNQLFNAYNSVVNRTGVIHPPGPETPLVGPTFSAVFASAQTSPNCNFVSFPPAPPFPPAPHPFPPPSPSPLPPRAASVLLQLPRAIVLSLIIVALVCTFVVFLYRKRSRKEAFTAAPYSSLELSVS